MFSWGGERGENRGVSLELRHAKRRSSMESENSRVRGWMKTSDERSIS